MTERVLRFVVGFVFLASGTIKIADPERFYIDLRGFGFLPDPLSAVVAAVLPPFELICALAFITGICFNGAAFLLSASLVAFMGLLIYMLANNIDATCGCFGEWIVFPSLEIHLAFNVVLLITVMITTALRGKRLMRKVRI